MTRLRLLFLQNGTLSAARTVVEEEPAVAQTVQFDTEVVQFDTEEIEF